MIAYSSANSVERLSTKIFLSSRKLRDESQTSRRASAAKQTIDSYQKGLGREWRREGEDRLRLEGWVIDWNVFRRDCELLQHSIIKSDGFVSGRWRFRSSRLSVGLALSIYLSANCQQSLARCVKICSSFFACFSNKSHLDPELCLPLTLADARTTWGESFTIR